MRVPLSPLLLATAWLAGAGCASHPREQPPVASTKEVCSDDASNPLHLSTLREEARKADARPDFAIESILMQRGEPRLLAINRQMYQSLHALDVELRREQRLAACEKPAPPVRTLEAQSNSEAPGGVVAASGVSGGMGATPGASGGMVATVASTTAGPTAPAPASASQSSIASGVSSGTARSTLVRKSGVSLGGSSGNGASMQKVAAGSDNDIVVRRLRKAAEQEKDPVLRAKLWKEYTDYRQGTSAK